MDYMIVLVCKVQKFISLGIFLLSTQFFTHECSISGEFFYFMLSTICMKSD